MSAGSRVLAGDGAALAALAARDAVVPGLEVLLSADALSDALGDRVRITRVRYKPGASVVVAFEGVRGPEWTAAYRTDDKPRKVFAHAERHGFEVRRIPGVPHSVVAGAFADRALWAPLATWRRAAPGAFEGASLFRHNPHRRMVFELADSFVKVVADDRGTGAPVQRALAAGGLPVLAGTVLGRGVTSTPRWGSGHLGAHRSAGHAVAAGAAVAALHAPGPGGSLAADARAAERVAAEEAERDAAAAAAAIDALVPGLASRARRIAREAVPRGPVVRLHGDLTADQVLVGDGVRLIDFDRSTWGHPARDLGCFLAGELSENADAALAEGFLDGYRRAGGVVDAVAVRRWTARCLLLRAVEPFRRAQPGWAASIGHVIARAEGLLS